MICIQEVTVKGKSYEEVCHAKGVESVAILEDWVINYLTKIEKQENKAFRKFIDTMLKATKTHHAAFQLTMSQRAIIQNIPEREGKEEILVLLFENCCLKIGTQDVFSQFSQAKIKTFLGNYFLNEDNCFNELWAIQSSVYNILESTNLLLKRINLIRQQDKIRGRDFVTSSQLFFFSTKDCHDLFLEQLLLPLCGIFQTSQSFSIRLISQFFNHPFSSNACWSESLSPVQKNERTSKSGYFSLIILVFGSVPKLIGVSKKIPDETFIRRRH
ncbi:MAG: hypothetical protein EZS28_043079 [Streblomastix strix]|uniref:Uncharacterized protein n=1 Tax=Streblomastix strix TaxID=222440 RepID=A0A5J4TSU1_9EUKA|nr:MAG: hypothetical protein EZS28_043079 [Streblomastix strix]